MTRNLLHRACDAVFRHDKWNIGVVNEPIHVFLEPATRPNIDWFPAPEQDRFLADPFAITKNDGVYIFCEEFDYRVAKGRIVYVELGSGNTPSQAKVAIERSFHLSYPYLLEYQGTVYCIPETFQAREISLYRAEAFPNRWAKIATLVDDVAATDNTVFQFQGRWWLTCGNDQPGSLLVWHAPDIFGPWEPHSANPVKTDIRSSRPAGTPFTHKGHLYRPAQDCSRTYGGRIVLNRVERLTPEGFEEEQVAVIEPSPNSEYPDGLHTLSAAGDVTVLDGKCLFRSSLTDLVKGRSNLLANWRVAGRISKVKLPGRAQGSFV